MFYNPSTLKRWARSVVEKAWRDAREKAGSALRIHDMCHRYAIRLAEAGCPMHFISEVLGHGRKNEAECS